MKTFGT